MTDTRKPDKKEFDADQVIRDYEESSETEDENQTTMEWYEQASQDTTVPSEAVLAGGDIDAAWDQASSGEETVGGSSPTPDQDIVDEIGRAVGINYEDAEPLNTEKIERRDQERWELHPASSEDFSQRSQAFERQAPSSAKPVAGSKPPPASAKKEKRKAA
jgi:uncharacterized protein DUF6335